MEPFQLKDPVTGQPAGPYWIKFKVPGETGYRRVVGGGTLAAARKALARTEAQIEDGTWKDPRLERKKKRAPLLDAPKTLGQLFERFIEAHDDSELDDGRSPATVKGYRHARNVVFRVLPAETPLKALEKHVLREARGKLEKLAPTRGAAPLFKPSTINLTLTKLRSVLSWADEQEYPALRPGLAVSVGNIQRGTSRIVGNCKQIGEGDFCTDEEVRRILAEADGSEHPEMACRLAFGFGTGARISEIAGVKWCDIDFKERTVHIRRQAGGRLPKNKKTRIAPLSKDLVKRLQAWQLASPYSAPEHPVFPRADGKHQSAHMKIDTVLARVAKRCGVVKPRYNNHSMRHSYISNWMRAGKSPFHLVRIVGHANTRLIEEVYGHLVTADLVAALDADQRPTLRPKKVGRSEQT